MCCQACRRVSDSAHRPARRRACQGVSHPASQITRSRTMPPTRLLACQPAWAVTPSAASLLVSKTAWWRIDSTARRHTRRSACGLDGVCATTPTRRHARQAANRPARTNAGPLVGRYVGKAASSTVRWRQHGLPFYSRVGTRVHVRGWTGTSAGRDQAASRSCWASGVSCSFSAARQRVRMAAGLQAQRAPAEAPDSPSGPYTATRMSLVVSVMRDRA